MERRKSWWTRMCHALVQAFNWVFIGKVKP